MLKRKDTAMGFSPAIALAITLLALAPVVAQAQPTGNPWNPYQAKRAQPSPAPIMRATPQYISPTQNISPTPQAAPSPPRQPRSRFAPQGLEQQLSTAAALRPVAPVNPIPVVRPPANSPPRQPQTYAAPPIINPVPNPVPGGYANVPGYAPQGFAPQGYAPQRFAPQGYRQGYANAPSPQGRVFGGYPQGYPGNTYSGYGPNGPVTPYGIPGGLGGFAPFPGNNTNGGVPGFNFSPFGFF